MAFNFFGGLSFINALGDSIHKVFQQFLHACKILLHEPTHNTLALESLAVIESFCENRLGKIQDFMSSFVLSRIWNLGVD